MLILLGNGDGTFRPFEPVKAAIALAVADLTGNGVPDFVFADQSLNQVTVVYGTTSQSANSPQVIGNQTTGLLAPGAVMLADLNGDGIPDLIVANSGGNNVLVYPGLGNGQFGPPINGTAGLPRRHRPDRTDGRQPQRPARPAGRRHRLQRRLGPAGPGQRVELDDDPGAADQDRRRTGRDGRGQPAGRHARPTWPWPTAGPITSRSSPASAAGSSTTSRRRSRRIPVGQAPSSLFLGNFNGLGQGLATLNAGSNDGTLISELGSANPVTQSFPTGGDSPTTGFAGDFTGNGFTDLVVGNNGDGHLALLLGGPAG